MGGWSFSCFIFYSKLVIFLCLSKKGYLWVRFSFEGVITFLADHVGHSLLVSVVFRVSSRTQKSNWYRLFVGFYPNWCGDYFDNGILIYRWDREEEAVIVSSFSQPHFLSLMLFAVFFRFPFSFLPCWNLPPALQSYLPHFTVCPALPENR